MTLLDEYNTPIAGAFVMLNANAGGAVTTNSSGVASFSGMSFPADVHIFSPHVASTPVFRPEVSSVFGVNAGSLTYGFKSNRSCAQLSGSIGGLVNSGDQVRVRTLPSTDLGGGNWTIGGAGGYSFGSNCEDDRQIGMSFVEYNGSPTGTPVAAAFLPVVLLTPGVPNTVNVTLTPIAGFSIGTTAVNFTYNANYSNYNVQLSGGPAAGQHVAVQDAQTICFSSCGMSFGSVYDASWLSYQAFMGASDGAGTYNAFQMFTGGSFPTVLNPSYLNPGTIVSLPTSGGPTLSYVNSSGVGAQLHFAMRPASGGGDSWEMWRPGVAAGASGTAGVPTVFPAGVPATYGPQPGITYDDQLHQFVTSGGFSLNDLRPSTLFTNLTDVTEHRLTAAY